MWKAYWLAMVVFYIVGTFDEIQQHGTVPKKPRNGGWAFAGFLLFVPLMWFARRAIWS